MESSISQQSVYSKWWGNKRSAVFANCPEWLLKLSTLCCRQTIKHPQDVQVSRNKDWWTTGPIQKVLNAAKLALITQNQKAADNGCTDGCFVPWPILDLLCLLRIDFYLPRKGKTERNGLFFWFTWYITLNGIPFSSFGVYGTSPHLINAMKLQLLQSLGDDITFPISR